MKVILENSSLKFKVADYVQLTELSSLKQISSVNSDAISSSSWAGNTLTATTTATNTGVFLEGALVAGHKYIIAGKKINGSNYVSIGRGGTYGFIALLTNITTDGSVASYTHDGSSNNLLGLRDLNQLSFGAEIYLYDVTEYTDEQIANITYEMCKKNKFIF